MSQVFQAYTTFGRAFAKDVTSDSVHSFPKELKSGEHQVFVLDLKSNFSFNRHKCISSFAQGVHQSDGLILRASVTCGGANLHSEMCNRREL